MPSIKTSISLEEDLHWRLKEEVPKRRMQDKEAISQALELWLAAGPNAASLLGLLQDKESPLRESVETLVERWSKSRAAAADKEQEAQAINATGKKTALPRAVNQRR